MNKLITLRQFSLILLVLVILSGVMFNWVLKYNLDLVETRIEYSEKRIQNELLEYDKLTDEMKTKLDDFANIFAHDMIRNLQDLRYSYSRSRKQMEFMEDLIPHIRSLKHNLNNAVGEMNQLKRDLQAAEDKKK